MAGAETTGKRADGAESAGGTAGAVPAALGRLGRGIGAAASGREWDVWDGWDAAAGVWDAGWPLIIPIPSKRPRRRSCPSSLTPQSNEGPAGPWLLAPGTCPGGGGDVTSHWVAGRLPGVLLEASSRHIRNDPRAGCRGYWPTGPPGPLFGLGDQKRVRPGALAGLYSDFGRSTVAPTATSHGRWVNRKLGVNLRCVTR